jgi:hypothetical protein
MEKEIKEIQDEINILDIQIKHIKQNLSDSLKSFLPKKCEYCGCYDGIHKTDCSFMKKYW